MLSHYKLTTVGWQPHRDRLFRSVLLWWLTQVRVPGSHGPKRTALKLRVVLDARVKTTTERLKRTDHSSK